MKTDLDEIKMREMTLKEHLDAYEVGMDQALDKRDYALCKYITHMKKFIIEYAKKKKER